MSELKDSHLQRIVEFHHLDFLCKSSLRMHDLCQFQYYELSRENLLRNKKQESQGGDTSIISAMYDEFVQGYIVDTHRVIS